MLRVTRFLNWVLWWMYYVLWIGMIGGAITFFSFRAGHITFALAAGLITCALIAGVVAARSKDIWRLHTVLKDWPLTSVALHKQAAASMSMLTQPYQEALPAWERATQEQPNDPANWTRLAFALNILGRPEEALAASEHGLHLDPTHASAWARKAAALANLGRTEEALAVCDQALALNPGDASAWRTKALTLLRLGRTQEASSAFDRISPPDPDVMSPKLNAHVWYSKGYGLYRLERYVEAIEAYDTVLAVYPTLVAGWLYKAACLYKLGRRTEARAAARHAQKLAGQ